MQIYFLNDSNNGKKMKFLVIYWTWVDCTISITIKKLWLIDFTKKSKQVFHSNKHKCVKRKKKFEKIFSFEI
jgi:hypothetical protein